MPRVIRHKIATSGINRPFASCIEANTLPMSAPLHWLELAVRDFSRAPLLSLGFGLCFGLATFAIIAFVYTQNSHVVILPSLVLLMLAGPFLATSLYSISWSLARDKTPSLGHALSAIVRNRSNQLIFTLMLTFVMVLWMRVAALVHVFYPTQINAMFYEYVPFLFFGSIAGLGLLTVVFMASAFAIPVMMERRIDVMSAIATSFNAVNKNRLTMLLWALIICLGVLIGIATAGIAMIIIMPILGYATWHGYLATIKTKLHRHYE